MYQEVNVNNIHFSNTFKFKYSLIKVYYHSVQDLQLKLNRLKCNVSLIIASFSL